MIAVNYLICRWRRPGSLHSRVKSQESRVKTATCSTQHTTPPSSRDSGSVAKDGNYISAVDHCLSQNAKSNLCFMCDKLSMISLKSGVLVQRNRSIGPIPHQLHLKAPIRVELDVEKVLIDSFFFHTLESIPCFSFRCYLRLDAL